MNLLLTRLKSLWHICSEYELRERDFSSSRIEQERFEFISMQQNCQEPFSLDCGRKHTYTSLTSQIEIKTFTFIASEHIFLMFRCLLLRASLGQCHPERRNGAHLWRPVCLRWGQRWLRWLAGQWTEHEPVTSGTSHLWWSIRAEL